jgi:polyisoprenoid-binding protein YceI
LNAATTLRRRGRALALALIAILPAARALAADASWTVRDGDVRVLVPLKPGGAFEARSTALSGTLTAGAAHPLSVGGEVALDLSTIDTGIALRNQHLREKYLQVDRGAGFDKAVLSGIVVNDAQGPAFEGRSAFSATLLLHGVSHPVSGTAEFRHAASGVRVEASFPLVLTDHGVEPPMYLGVGVASKVMVKVSFTAAPAGGGAK